MSILTPRTFSRRKRSPEDFAAEIRSHLELEADELSGEGLDEAEARRRARVAFGSVPAAQERFRLRGRFIPLDHLLRDLRFGLRALRQTPGFTLTAILTLALGVGANTAVFSVMNAVLLRSLPIRDPQNVVYLHTSGTPSNSGTIDSNATFPYSVYRELRTHTDVFSDVITVGGLSPNKLNVRIGAQPEQAEADAVSGNFFSGLGVQIIRGRGFTSQDEAGHAPITVLSYNYWTRRFGRDPGVLGQTLYVKGVPVTIVGVAARGFEGTDSGQSIDFWIPLQDRAEFNILGNPPEDGKLYQHNPRWWCLRIMARLAPDVTRAQALSRIQPVFQRAAYVDREPPMQGERAPVLSFDDARSFSGYEEMYGKPLRMLMAMVALVLLIALTNVVMLLLARNAARQREFSVRMALGAGRAELLRQLLCEGLLLVVAGGALAWAFALIATRMLGVWALIESSLAPDRTVLLFTLAVLVAAALLFALAPLRFALADGATLALKTSAATSNSDAGKTRLGKLIVSLQMALCLVLLVGAGLLVRTLRNLENVPLGFDTNGLVVFGLNPQGLHSQPELVRFYQDLQRRLRALPGVESVAVMSERIGAWWSNNSNVMIDGKDPDPGKGGSTLVRENEIGPDFFHTLGVPILQGREFTDADNAKSPYVAIVNQLFVDTFLPGQSPIGHKVNMFTIIGVVANHKYRSIDEEPVPMAWWCYQQAPGEGALNIEMRVRGNNPLTILPTVQKVVASMDPNVPLIEPMLQRAQFEKTISRQLMFARLAEFFGILAVVLVATGLYGTLAFRVNRRTAEIGVRMALGANRGQVVWMVLRDSLILTTTGILAGIPLAWLVGKELASSLYGVKPVDILTYACAIAGVVLVTLAASLLPASRAASVDPLKALRTE
jgi:predicted permease